jgi:hypothetical protein
MEGELDGDILDIISKSQDEKMDSKQNAKEMNVFVSEWKPLFAGDPV